MSGETELGKWAIESHGGSRPQPQRGVIRQPRAKPWVRRAKMNQALKGRDMLPVVPPFQGLVPSDTETQGFALGYRMAAFQA